MKRNECWSSLYNHLFKNFTTVFNGREKKIEIKIFSWGLTVEGGNNCRPKNSIFCLKFLEIYKSYDKYRHLAPVFFNCF